jgi:hypothetical protein
LVVAGGVEDEFADECSAGAVEHADVEVVDEDDDVGAGAVFGQADVVQAAVVADGDDAGGVDFVVSDAVVRRDLVSAGEGFGAVVKGLDGGVSGDGAVGSDPVVVGQEIIELVLQFGDCRGGREGGEPLFEGLVEALRPCRRFVGDTGVR